MFVAKSPSERSAAAKEAIWAAIAATPSWASSRPAQSSDSPSGTISAHVSRCQITPMSRRCPNSSSSVAPPPNSPDFCPYYPKSNYLVEKAVRTLTFPQYRDWRNYGRLEGEIKALYELIQTGKRSYFE